MESSEDLRNKIIQLKENIATILGPAATTVTLTGKALAERTIKQRGFGAQYQETAVPAWFNKGKGLNKKAEKRIQDENDNEEGGWLSWKEIRKEAGLQTDYVDLSYSNEMWRGMAPQQPYLENNMLIAPLAHNNTEGQNKMDWNRDRYGNFIQKVLEGENEELMAQVGVEESTKIIYEFLKPQ